MSQIEHPILGRITDSQGTKLEWSTEPLPIGEFGLKGSICMWTDKEEPNERLLNAAVSLLQSGADFKEKVEGHMFEAYQEDIREEYLRIVDDEDYSPIVRSEDVPALTKASEVWELIVKMNGIFIELGDSGEPDISLSFEARFDPSHDFVVRFKDGELCECMMDG